MITLRFVNVMNWDFLFVVSKLNGLSKQFICFSFPGDFA
jgi:hypothetical protein